MRLNYLLEKLGFSKNESLVYLASLESGVASAQQIATKAGLKRTTVYSVLSYLVGRGVVAKTIQKNKTRFVPEPPDKLLSMVSELNRAIKESLPELQALYNTSETKPHIIFWEGGNAIHNVYEDTLRERPKEILEWNTDVFFDRFPKDYNYIEKRVKFGIKARRIAGKGSRWDTHHKYKDTRELSETRIVSKDLFWPNVEINIYGNKIAFMDYAENMSVVIESESITNAMRQVYELSWRGTQVPGN